jgi:hypothetical protein
MKESDHVYEPPRRIPANEIPGPIADFLNGEDLESKTSQALRLSTVDAEGWPHAALLSAGDMLALPGGRIRLALHPGSSTSANLARDGRLTLTMVVGRGLCELWMHATKLGEGVAEIPLAFFEAKLEATRQHQAPYADVTSGVTFALHDPEAVLARWRRQIAALRDPTGAGVGRAEASRQGRHRRPSNANHP